MLLDNNKFLAMSKEEFDNYMCQNYPYMFIERNMPMSKTCMCWGFDIGKGWYFTLANLCQQLDLIKKSTGLYPVFTQIKEKYGSARFYYRIEKDNQLIAKKNVDIWCDIIDILITDAESKCDYICASCGKDKEEIIEVEHWLYDECEECFKKNNGKNQFKKWWEKVNAKNFALNAIYYAEQKDLKRIITLCKNIIKAFQKKLKKRLKFYLNKNAII